MISRRVAYISFGLMISGGCVFFLYKVNIIPCSSYLQVFIKNCVVDLRL
jgi:hypothetical protein